MSKAIILYLTFPLLVACGSSLDTGKKFREEKDDRIEAQRALYETLNREEQIKKLMSRATATEHYIWVWSSSMNLADYNEAKQVCTDIGFDLPTKTMLVEANQNENIKMGTTFSGELGQAVYILDHPSDFAITVLCAKPH